MFELFENSLFAYADNSTLLPVADDSTLHTTGNRPAVAASLNKDLARIQDWCNYLCMMLNLNKTKRFIR